MGFYPALLEMIAQKSFLIGQDTVMHKAPVMIGENTHRQRNGSKDLRHRLHLDGEFIQLFRIDLRRSLC
jgi:hypothetical protein